MSTSGCSTRWRRAWRAGSNETCFSRARGYASSLEAALEPSHIPVEVFRNVVQTFRDNVGTWHRYWRIRRQALGVEVLKPYDTRAPLSPHALEVPYEDAVEWIAEGVAPL